MTEPPLPPNPPGKTELPPNTEDTDETNDSPLSIATPPPVVPAAAAVNRPCSEESADERSPDGGASDQRSLEDMAEWHGTAARREKPATKEKFGGESLPRAG